MSTLPRPRLINIGLLALAALAVTPLISPIIFEAGKNVGQALAYALTYAYAIGVALGIVTFGRLCRVSATSDTESTPEVGHKRRRYWSVAIAASVIVATATTIVFEDGLNQQHAYWVKLVVRTDSSHPPLLTVRYGNGASEVERFQWQPASQTILSMKRVVASPSNSPIRIDQLIGDGRPVAIGTVVSDGGIRVGNGITLTALNGMLRWPVAARRVSFYVSGSSERVRFYWLDQTKDIKAEPRPQEVSFDLGGNYQGWALLPPQEIDSLSIEASSTQTGAYTIDGRLFAQPEQWAHLTQVQFATFSRNRVSWPGFKPVNVRRPKVIAFAWLCIFVGTMIAFFLLLRVSAYAETRRRAPVPVWPRPSHELRAFLEVAAVIWTICVLYQLAFACAVRTGFTNDSIAYYAMAKSFINSPSLDDIVTVRTPGYPIFIAIVLRILGDTARGIAISQHLALASLSVIALWCLWDRLPRRWAVTAGLLAGAAPAVCAMGNILWTEALFSAFACSAALFASRFGRGSVYMLLAGMSAGAATMFRPNGVLLLIVTGGFLLLHFLWNRGERSLRPYVSAGGLVVGGYLMIAAPWHMHLALDHQTFTFGKGLKEFGAWAGYVFEEQLPVSLPINRPDRAIYADPQAYRNEPYVAQAEFPLIFGNALTYYRETEREWLASEPLTPYAEALKYYATLTWHPVYLHFEFKEIRWFLDAWAQSPAKTAASQEQLRQLLTTLTTENLAGFEFLRTPCLAVSEFVLNHWIYLAALASLGILMCFWCPWLLPIALFVLATVLGFSTNLVPGERYIAVLEPLYYVLGIAGLYGLWSGVRGFVLRFARRASITTRR